MSYRFDNMIIRIECACEELFAIAGGADAEDFEPDSLLGVFVLEI